MIRLTILILSFVLSACSVIYQLGLARSLSPLIQDEVLSHSLTIATFLLTMGLGSAWVYTRVHSEPLKSLFRVEIALSVLGACAIGFVEVIHLVFVDHTQSLIAWSQLYVAAVGFLSGAELPLLLAVRIGLRSGTLLCLSYIGGLAGAILIGLSAHSSLPLFYSLIWTSIINVIAASVIWFISGFGTRRVLLLLLPASVIYLFNTIQPAFEQVHLKALYLGARPISWTFDGIKDYLRSLESFGDVQRIITPYQTIDIVPDRFTPEVLGGRDQYTLYMNGQQQFTKESFEMYHQSMAHGALNLTSLNPREVLILGGGDGLLAAELLRVPSIESIVLVEIDPSVIEIAKSDLTLLQMNKSSLNSPKLTIHIDDAFSFIRSKDKTFDVIFMDFPFPTGFEVARLYSLEFYRNVLMRLNPGGAIVLDLPIRRDHQGYSYFEVDPNSPQRVVWNTLKASGLESLLVFGPFETFVVGTVEPRELVFDYTVLPDFLSHRTFMNLIEIPHQLGSLEYDPEIINSALKPRNFWSQEKK